MVGIQITVEIEIVVGILSDRLYDLITKTRNTTLIGI